MLLFLLLIQPENKISFFDSPYFTIIVSVSSGIAGGLLTIWYTRKEARKKLLVDLTTQELYPRLYLPLISEYQRIVDAEITGGSPTLRIKEIERVIFENILLVKLAPKNIQTKINNIYYVCKSIDNPQKYQEKVNRVRESLVALKEEITITFEGYLK